MAGGGSDGSVSERTPLLSRGSLAQTCLAASLPKDGRSQQYEFAEPSDAAEFCIRHRHLIVQRLRSSFSEQQGERLLAIGVLETKEGAPVVDHPLVALRGWSRGFSTIKICRVATISFLPSQASFVLRIS